MVSTVTTYHKGYSTTGSTKIIYRYLPKEVGELLVYYLWLVRPFYRKLELLSQSKNVESNAYALDSARIQISLGLRQRRAHWIQACWIHLE
jgi:hypothetical protein